MSGTMMPPPGAAPFYTWERLLEIERRTKWPMEALLASKPDYPAMLNRFPDPELRERNAKPGHGPGQILSPQQAIFLSMRYQHGATPAECAEMLDLSVSRVNQIRDKALRALSVEGVRELAKTVPTNNKDALMSNVVVAAPGKWAHEPEGDPHWRLGR